MQNQFLVRPWTKYHPIPPPPPNLFLLILVSILLKCHASKLWDEKELINNLCWWKCHAGKWFICYHHLQGYTFLRHKVMQNLRNKQLWLAKFFWSKKSLKMNILCFVVTQTKEGLVFTKNLRKSIFLRRDYCCCPLLK